MKRSTINAAILWAEGLLKSANICLPSFAYWDLPAFKANRAKIGLHKAVMLGWDITDFGTGRFDEIGAVLFTARNGSLHEPGLGSPYAEKYILLKEGQCLPNHYHATKTEDIINRAGGVMEMRFFNKKEDGSVDGQSQVQVYVDGIKTTLAAGEELLVYPGSGVCIPPYLYHIFGAKKGRGPLIVGEVSSINDDTSDNHFADPTQRFAAIEEDEPAYKPLCNEYDRL